MYRDNKFPSSIVVSYSAAAKDGIVFEGNDTLNQKVQKTSQKEAKRMTAAVYELADFILCTPKDDSVTGIYGALRQAGSSDDEPYYNIYKIQTEREREKNENRIIRTNWSIKRSY